uniref:Uncharacterized protein n=1 Tax=Trichuris muris TaxID=70415 RepID=A0A5S6QIS4_TRIMR
MANRIFLFMKSYISGQFDLHPMLMFNGVTFVRDAKISIRTITINQRYIYQWFKMLLLLVFVRAKVCRVF